MINVFQPSLGKAELDAVAEVLATNWLGHGPQTSAFEQEFAQHLGARPEQLMFLNSCTSGLFLAMELLDIGPGHEVVLPSISFVAAGNAIAASGATPVFCDVDPRTLNPSAEQVASRFTERTKAVLILHYGGYPGDIARIAELCRERGVPLVEDAACAVSSRVGDTACGTFGDIAMWSFDAMKVLVTGDGGMLYVRDTGLMERARRLAYHGLERASGFSGAKVTERWWELNVTDHARRLIGNDLTAAIGRVQLGRLPEFVERRAEVHTFYDRALADVPGLRLPPALPEGQTTSGYFYWVQMKSELRDEVAADLRDAGVYTTFRYPPLHLVEAFRPAWPTYLPNTEVAAEETLCLPIHQGLSNTDLSTVVTALRTALEARR